MAAFRDAPTGMFLRHDGDVVKLALDHMSRNSNILLRRGRELRITATLLKVAYRRGSRRGGCVCRLCTLSNQLKPDLAANRGCCFLQSAERYGVVVRI